MVKKYEVVHNCKKKIFTFQELLHLIIFFCKQCGIFFKKNTYKEKLNHTKNLKKFHLNVEQKIKSDEYLNRIEIDKFLINKFIKVTGHTPKKTLRLRLWLWKYAFCCTKPQNKCSSWIRY